MDHVLNAVTPKQRLMEQLTSRPCDDNDDDAPKENVVSADHPMMEKFQKALKEHLLKINDQLIDEIADIDQKISNLLKERNEIGCLVYDRQQETDRQKIIIDDYTNQLNEVTCKRLAVEEETHTLKEQHDLLNQKFKDIKRSHDENMLQLTNIRALEQNLMKWMDEIESELSIAKRVVKKDTQEKKLMLQQKRQTDFISFNLDTMVRSKERELRNVTEMCKDQEEQLAMLRQKLSDSATDLTVLQREQKNLSGAWNEVIVEINRKDHILQKMRDELVGNLENGRLLQAKIDGIKRTTNKEMEQNEKLEEMRCRIDFDFQIVENRLGKQNSEYCRLIKKIDTMDATLKITQSDISQAITEGLLLNGKKRNVQKQIEKQEADKQQTEGQILDFLQQQITSENTSYNEARKLRRMQEERRSLEINMLDTDYKLTSVLGELEKTKGKVLQRKDDIMALKEKRNNELKKLQDMVKEIDSINRDMNSKYKQEMMLNKQLKEKIDKSEKGEEKSPQELKIIWLEEQLTTIHKDIKEGQNYWINTEKKLFDLSEKYVAQSNTLDLARTQLLIIEQKILSIDFKLEEIKQQDAETIREQKHLNVKFDSLNAELYKTKQQNDVESNQCENNHRLLLEKLKNAEASAINLEKEIVDKEHEIVQNKQTNLERHRETLSWETKWKMIEETRKYREKEHSATSDISVMRAEIHRMEVRYQQLKRAQEKLSQDLEKCVAHRDHIFDNATIRSKIPESKTKLQFTNLHRLNELKNKLRHLHVEKMLLQKCIGERQCQKNDYFAVLKTVNAAIDEEKSQETINQQEIENAILMKQENLDYILRLQNRAKRFRTLLSGKQPLKCRNESLVASENIRQQEINNHLVSVLESLLTEFPDHSFSIRRVIQTLKIAE